MSRRLEALRALAERGSTPGERAAAAEAPAPALAAPERFAHYHLIAVIQQRAN